MNRKAELEFDVARKNVYWMIAGFVIAIIILAFAFTLGTYTTKLTAVPREISAELLALRFTAIPECFAYVDPHTQQAVSGTIDLSRFTPTQMNTCYAPEAQSGFKTFNFRLRLEQGQQEITTNNYFHEDDFILIKEVRVYDAGTVRKDRLFIHVQEKI